MTIWNSWLNRGRLKWRVLAGANRSEVAAVIHALQSKATITKVQNTDDESIIAHIRTKTVEQNRNNLTRTAAYLRFYQAHPEVHWALLAHVVSRNGGWNMTDTRGDWFTRMADSHTQRWFYDFLERANWLIFHDAYPQLLLYAEGKARRKDLSYLLQMLEVSRFMQAIWPLFWQTQNSQLLTRALVINEQNYIDQRVIQNKKYAGVLRSLPFRVQSLFNLNQVLMPYRQDHTTRFFGTTIHHFARVEDRIGSGLRLYHGLFDEAAPRQPLLQWLETVEHTASRWDYWPHFFCAERNAQTNGETMQHQSVVGELRFPAECRVYSPRLCDVWPDVSHDEAEPGDWFTDMRHTIYLWSPVKRPAFDSTRVYTDSIKAIERAIAAKEQLDNLFAK